MLISYESILGITTLVMLEIVLGIDNIIFINLLVSKLPKPRQDFARKLGILLAMFSRLLLLSCIGFLLTLN
jgi:predicted tellurium resistance membrane protein TerC